MLQTFSYWHDDDLRPIGGFLSEMALVSPRHFVLNDAVAISLIQRHFPDRPDFAEAYAALQIPASKADVARYLALYEAGGLYLDVHFGFVDPARVTAFLLDAMRPDVMLVDVSVFISQKPPGFVRVGNTVMACRKGHPLMRETAARALTNIAEKRQRERAVGFEPYHIYRLTGPGLLNDVFFDSPYSNGATVPPRLKPEAGRAWIAMEDGLPIYRNLNKAAYTRPGSHWSERQRHELLFRQDG